MPRSDDGPSPYFLNSTELSTCKAITPFVWFNGDAEAAINFYVSIFKNSKVGRVTRNGAQGPGPAGTVLSATSFQLEGQEFMALNGGPQFSFSPAISFLRQLRDAGGGR